MGRRGRRRNQPRRKIPKRPKIWGGDQPEPGNISATGGCGLGVIEECGCVCFFTSSFKIYCRKR